MPGESLQHGAVYAQALARDLLADGFSEKQVFQGTGLDRRLLTGDRPIADFDKIAALFERAADLTGNDLVGLQRGQVREMRRSGLICYVGISAPTIRDMLRSLARYRRVFSDAVELDLSGLDDEGTLLWHYNIPHSVPHRQHSEFAAAGLLQAIRNAANRQIAPERVAFHHPRNAHMEAFDRYFGCPVQFGAPHNVIQLRKEDLGTPLVTADNDLYATLKECGDSALQQKSRKVPALVAEVDRAIAERLSSGGATQDEVARALGMSPRTLSRRLAERGTSFFRILDDLRRSLAISYLRNSDLTLAETAFLLGYSGLSSFNDAFKRWTGRTPGQFRAK